MRQVRERAVIRQLDPVLAARIAAGEVVERPASVVKELLENAIDAGATRVRIEIEEGGQALIRVQDDGHGIAPSEVELAFRRHATSKLAALDDLFNIRTLGFRGEALPSIAAVAEVELATRASGHAHGMVVQARGTEVSRALPRGLPAGTTVTVRDLFAGVPARRKFLKSRAGEAAAVQSVVAHYAMAYPGLRLALYCDGRPAFASPGSGALADVLGALYGAEVAGRLVELRGEHRDTAVWGLTSPPDLSRPSRTYQSFFVNGRWVRNRMLAVALEDAYHTHLMVGRHPICVVHLAVPPAAIDVNVHPAKTEVKFLYDREVFAAVRNAATAVVLATMPAPGRVLSGVDLPGPAALTASHFPACGPGRSGPSASLSSGRIPVGRSEELEQAPLLLAGSAPAAPLRDGADGPAPRERPERAPLLRVLGQANSLYIIAEGAEGVYMVDQHAAHERVLFDELMDAAPDRPIASQLLLEPLAIELSPIQFEALERCAADLEPLGFAVELFGVAACLVRAVPSMLGSADPADTLRELLENSAGGEEARATWRERAFTTMACKSAVKAGQTLGLEEMRQLLYRLETTSRPRTCPHGRPTMILLSSSQLEREFGRRG